MRKTLFLIFLLMLFLARNIPAAEQINDDLFLNSVILIEIPDPKSLPAYVTGWVISISPETYQIATVFHNVENKAELKIHILKSKNIVRDQGLEYDEISLPIKIIYQNKIRDFVVFQVEKKRIPVELKPLKINLEPFNVQLGDEFRITGYGYLNLPIILKGWAVNYSKTNKGYVGHLEKTNGPGLSGAPVWYFSKEKNEYEVIGYISGGYSYPELKILGIGNFFVSKPLTDLRDDIIKILE